jgi:hypothetical protein
MPAQPPCALGLAALLLLASAVGSDSALTIPLNFSALGVAYDGIGALSGGGGVTRLLIDYPAEIQEDIYDILFKPLSGAALQIIKVEIGGACFSRRG